MKIAKNQAVVKELTLPSDEIVFQSQLTPSAIVYWTREQIVSVAKSEDVVAIDYYDDTEYFPPYYENQRKTMRADMAYECSGLKGNNVNVLMNDHGVVRSDGNYYNRVSP